MSQFDIKRAVENITKGKTNVYTPLVEAVVNAIDSIDLSERRDGLIEIIFQRSIAQPLDFDNNSLADISNITVIDNGVGFNKENRDSFDTLYSNFKKDKGAKGYGRFTFLKYFSSISISSVYKEGKTFRKRTFDFGFDKDIVVNEEDIEINVTDTKTEIHLNDLKEGTLDKRIDTIARRLLEKLLIYFIDDKYSCPKIILKESGMSGIILNDLIKKTDGEIQLVANVEKELSKAETKKIFTFKVFKIYYPNNNKSKISLTAHNREVTENNLSIYVPEFADDFYEDVKNQDGTFGKRDYFIKTYVMSDYLNEHVSLERGDFNFNDKNNSFLYDFSREEIEKLAAQITKESFAEEVKVRSEKKIKKIEKYIQEEAPWYKEYVDEIDTTSIPYNLDNKTIESEIHRVKYDQEIKARKKIEQIINDPKKNLDHTASEAIGQISKAKFSELAHYIALRKVILNLFEKSLESDKNGDYELEESVHSIIFPLKSDSDDTRYKDHNLWILDERLNFTEYVSSDKPLNGGKTNRVDLISFGKRAMFRGGNDIGNPITIFEFKRPGRDDFTDSSSKEDPVEQIIRYVNDIKDGKYKTKGRDILVGENTPFYGYVICDLTQKVNNWLRRNKDFIPMPDGMGWFKWHGNNNLYIEVLSWDKMLKDAELRNKVFFNKLGLE